MTTAALIDGRMQKNVHNSVFISYTKLFNKHQLDDKYFDESLEVF